MSPFLVLPRVLAKPLRWPIDSVRTARHNAFAATAALAVRRAEREDVDRFLVEHSLGERHLIEQPVAERDAAEPVEPVESVVTVPEPRAESRAEPPAGQRTAPTPLSN